MQTTIVEAEPSRPDHDALARWRRSITWGNRAFDERDYPSAIAHYDAAVSTAESMYGRLDDAEAGTAAWVVAHHNLADTYERLGRDCDQCRHLCAAHARLCDTMNRGGLPIRWQAAAQRHCRRTYAELTHFAARHPDDEAAREACQLGAAGATQGLPRQ
ncbi:hypothetical protein [Burkholderia gladioli]|uniref:TPR repeat family protein n=1 Tax=Burkholderia gladioli TaxID=28095 RepID=A0AAW3EQ78_BURGA|nr:hypothetical protein [Burkholderia gladioli]AJW99973.1 TPR repeat family protein [Burkholderia gladioli]ASD78727.1 hypothetical protein CEJ98_06700 [Burkholderia gladioli pv. gladioli]AWY56026.1 hypothetical protein A8H28_34455 [Burkholderia gladioli pv. gladioli]KGC10013.1 TPR repeat family protein [Burkholderia gladioli]KKJ05681.1 hypothetical protein XF14_16575 [Burkholderia gladioli]